jgi:hypothetical protein
MNKKEYLKTLEDEYNKEARLWNSIPGGPRLVFPKDRFMIQYCWCKEEGAYGEQEVAGFTIRYCTKCGFPLKGEWKDS